MELWNRVTTQIGIIAEDVSDVETMYALTCKIVREESFKFRRFVGQGCGKMVRKCRPWSRNLRLQGCEHLVVVHDLDNKDPVALHKLLESLVADSGFLTSLILIPVREMEAWLLCDGPALKKVFRLSQPAILPANPEALKDPKAEIQQVIKKAGGRRYLNTVHNEKIAKECKVQLIEDRCASFRPYVKFVRLAATLNPGESAAPKGVSKVSKKPGSRPRRGNR